MKKNQIFDKQSNSLDIQKRVFVYDGEWRGLSDMQHTDGSRMVTVFRGDTCVHPTAAGDLSHTQLFCPLITEAHSEEASGRDRLC